VLAPDPAHLDAMAHLL
jgi:hypothetical protein